MTEELIWRIAQTIELVELGLNDDKSPWKILYGHYIFLRAISWQEEYISIQRKLIKSKLFLTKKQGACDE